MLNCVGRWVVLGLLAAVLPGCGGTEPIMPGPEYAIQGLILDATGDPVAGAPVSVVFPMQIEDYDPHSHPRRSHLRAFPNYVFSFSIETPCVGSVSVRDFRDRHVRTLVDSRELVPGNHNFNWRRLDESNVLIPNGVYQVRLDFENPAGLDPQVLSGILINSGSDNYGIEAGISAHCDSLGRFVIPFNDLPIGELYRRPPSGWEEIPDSLWLQTIGESGKYRVMVRLGAMDRDVDALMQDQSLLSESLPPKR
jgi:hypothetical protein